MMRRTGLLILWALSALVGCRPATPSGDPADLAASAAHEPAAPRADEAIQLADWTQASGVQFVHTNGAFGAAYIMESVASGLAVFDYDGDGLSDIYFCNGAALPGDPSPMPASHKLYRNLGQMQFRDVSVEAGITCGAFGLGVTVGDYNNDGWPDIYVNNYGPNVLYENNGDGSFTDVAQSGGAGLGERVGAGTCFLDLEGDGDLDLFVGHYVKFSVESHRAIQHAGRRVYPGPLDYPPETNVLLRNEGNGRWTDISGPAGLSDAPGTGMGVIAGDFDDDGDTDVFVANDEMANFLFRNNGQGGFEEVGIFSGVAFNAMGVAHGSMGVDCADYDNDGRSDCFVTSFQHEKTTLYANLGGGLFQDVSQLTGADAGTSAQVTWGCCFGDLDNDGDRDLFVACGHLDQRDENDVYRAANIVLKNELAETGRARFLNISEQCGQGPRARHSSRGAAIDDLDNDGDLDLVVLNSSDKSTLIKNAWRERQRPGHWLQLQLRGRRSNRDGVGARVRLTVGDLLLVDEVHSGRGYQSHWGSRLHFGLGDHTRVDRIEIRWSGGPVQELTDVGVDQLMTVREPSTGAPSTP